MWTGLNALSRPTMATAATRSSLRRREAGGDAGSPYTTSLVSAIDGGSPRDGFGMTTIYREADATPAIKRLLTERRIAVIGYGNQGRSQALNLRDSGAEVVIGNINDRYAEKAWMDEFTVLPVAE